MYVQIPQFTGNNIFKNQYLSTKFSRNMSNLGEKMSSHSSLQIEAV